MEVIGEEKAKRVAYRQYLSPTVAARLINYYASDEGYSKVRIAADIAAALPELVERLPELDFEKLIDLTSPEVYGSISSLVAREFFGRLGDFVANYGNIMWYANIDVITAINSLVQKSKEVGQMLLSFDFTEPANTLFTLPRINATRELWAGGVDFSRIANALDWLAGSADWIKVQLESFQLGDGLQRFFRDIVLQDEENRLRKIIVGDLKIRDIELGAIADRLEALGGDVFYGKIYDWAKDKNIDLLNDVRGNIRERVAQIRENIRYLKEDVLWGVGYDFTVGFIHYTSDGESSTANPEGEFSHAYHGLNREALNRWGDDTLAAFTKRDKERTRPREDGMLFVLMGMKSMIEAFSGGLENIFTLQNTLLDEFEFEWTPLSLRGK